MENLKEAILEMQKEINAQLGDAKHDWERKCLLLALEQIKDAAIRLDCPENEW